MPQEYKLLLKNADEPGYSNDIECYERNGGYQAFRKVLAIKTIKDSNNNEITPQAQLRTSVLDSPADSSGASFDTQTPNQYTSSATRTNPSPAHSRTNRLFIKILIS